MSEIEQVFMSVASTIKLAGEITSVGIIGIGFVVALYLFFKTIISKQKIQYVKLRLVFGRFLVIALEFQLAADIVGTAVAPSWEQIGQLAAIALIRTFLNYFLNRDITYEEKEVKETEISKR